MSRAATTWVGLCAFLLLSTAANAQDTPILSLESGGHTAIVRKLLFSPDGRTLNLREPTRSCASGTRRREACSIRSGARSAPGRQG